jgi:hypothetical protein
VEAASAGLVNLRVRFADRLHPALHVSVQPNPANVHSGNAHISVRFRRYLLVFRIAEAPPTLNSTTLFSSAGELGPGLNLNERAAAWFDVPDFPLFVVIRVEKWLSPT